jgi:hypothetical protein
MKMSDNIKNRKLRLNIQPLLFEITIKSTHIYTLLEVSEVSKFSEGKCARGGDTLNKKSNATEEGREEEIEEKPKGSRVLHTFCSSIENASVSRNVTTYSSPMKHLDNIWDQLINLSTKTIPPSSIKSTRKSSQLRFGPPIDPPIPLPLPQRSLQPFWTI